MNETLSALSARLPYAAGAASTASTWSPYSSTLEIPEKSGNGESRG